MEKKCVAEKELHPASGGLMLLLLILAVLASLALFVFGTVRIGLEHYLAGGIMTAAGFLGLMVFSLMMAGLKIVKPNEARILILLGKYYGTIKTPGFFYVNPLCTSFSPAYEGAKAQAMAEASEKNGQIVISATMARKCISLKTQTLNNQRQKVNDVLGNPIIIGAVVIWHVEDPTRAVFSVENYAEFLSIQADSTVRNIARLYPYDLFDDDPDGDGIPEKTLRGSSMEIADNMRDELQKRVDSAGLVIEEVRITHLAYAEEIAAAMLQRQQAVAIIAARQKIVDGAVGMVKMAIDKLGEDKVVMLDEERKAAMVSNLLVVLCGNKDAQPVLNSGSIY